MKNPIRKYILQAMPYKTADGAGEIGWGMMFLCCGLPCCMTFLLPSSMWKLGIGLLLVLCGALAMCFVPMAIKTYVTWSRTGDGACRRATKCVRVGIIVSLVVVVGGSIWLVHLMQPELTRQRQYEMLHPDAINSRADKLLLAMFVVSGAFSYAREAGLISKHSWKWPLFVLIVLGPVWIDLVVGPGNMGLIMLFLGLVWLLSGGVTLYSCLRHTIQPALEPA